MSVTSEKSSALSIDHEEDESNDIELLCVVSKTQKLGDEYCHFDANQDSYTCTICPATMNSEQSFYMHRGGQKHQKKLATMKLLNPKDMKPTKGYQTREIALGSIMTVTTKPAMTTPRIQPELEKISEPIIGLDYVIEIQLLDSTQLPVYICKLCDMNCQFISLVSHLIGYRHRMAYFKEKIPDVHYEIHEKVPSKSAQKSLAKMHSRRMEGRAGRGKISVEVEASRHKSEGKRAKVEVFKDKKVDDQDFKRVLECVKKMRKSDVADLVQYTAKDLFRDAIERKVLTKDHAKRLYNARESIKKKFIEKEMESLSPEQMNTLAANIKDIRDGDKSFEDVFQFPSTKVGEAMNEILTELGSRNELIEEEQ